MISKTVSVTKTGVKVGSKGKVQRTPGEVAEILGQLPKSEARKIRKGLFGNGLRGLAAVRRAA